jgi:ABC-type branched-subunit amino acid transport system permease subunit
MSGPRRTEGLLAISAVLLLASSPLLPKWAVFLVTVALAKGLVVLGLLLLMRAGLVSFGQGLYYATGAYAAGMTGQLLHLSDAAPMLALAALASGAVAAVVGTLLAAYRGIFFAMLSLAFSMILYGLLVKTSALGSTDGFNVAVGSVAGFRVAGGSARMAVFALAVALVFAAAVWAHRFVSSHVGRLAPAVRDNELRVEYLGASVRSVVYLTYVAAAGLSGIGGALAGLAVGHIDPEMAYWTTSGEFVFVAILSGSASVAAPFAGAIAFEVLRSFAYEYSPNTWQLVVGLAMLLVILFLPSGLWSLFARRGRAR